MSSAACLHINWGPDLEVATAADHRPSRWCFLCRKPRVHTWHMIEDGPDRQPSYYDPVPVLRCERCHQDHTLGFGMAYDGPHYPEDDGVWKELCRQRAATWRALSEGNDDV